MKKLMQLIPFLAIAGVPLLVTAQDSGAPPATTEARSVVISAAQGSEGGEMEIMGFSSANGETMTFAAPMMFTGDGGSFTSAMPGMDQFRLLSSSEIQKELDFVGDQRDQFTRLQKEYNQRIQEKAGLMGKGGFDPKKAREIGDEIKSMQEQQKKDIEDLLLPHQISRLQQIQLQQKMKGMGTVNALSDKKVLEELGITEEQLAKLKERAKELSDEMQKKMQKLREETQENLLKELTSEQRAKLKSMTGEKFDYQPTSPMPGRIQNRIQRRQSDKNDG